MAARIDALEPLAPDVVLAWRLVHPLVGRLRCGEWLLFAGVHDLMHLGQLESLERTLAGGQAARS